MKFQVPRIIPCCFIASIWILYTASTAEPLLFRKLAHLHCRYFSINSNQYCARSKPVECQLSMRLLCRFIASIWILYTASTQLVLFRRMAHLCRYFTSNSNQYCARSKPVEFQLSMIFLLPTFGSTAKVYCASSKPVIFQCLAQY